MRLSAQNLSPTAMGFLYMALLFAFFFCHQAVLASLSVFGREGNSTMAAPPSPATMDTERHGKVVSSFQIVASPGLFERDTYTVEVGFGGQSLKLVPDCGSSDTYGMLWTASIWTLTILDLRWISGSRNDSVAHVALKYGRTLFNPTKSLTFKEISDSSFNISFADGDSIEGPLGSDTVTIGGASIEQQTFGLSLDVRVEDALSQPYDGILALGFPFGSAFQPSGARTILENLTPSLAKPLFSAHLPRHVAGTFDFGDVDDSKYVGDMAFVPVNSSLGSWQVMATAMPSVNSTSRLAEEGRPTFIGQPCLHVTCRDGI